MLFYSIDRKKACKRNTSICFLMLLPILFGFITEIFWGKLNGRQYKGMVIVILKWVINCILRLNMM